MGELEMPSSSAICPTCTSSYNMEVSNKDGYAFYCTMCDEHFHSNEIIGTTGDGYMLCFHDVSEVLYEKNHEKIQELCEDENIDYCVFSSYGNDHGMLEIGWGYVDESVYKFPDDDVIKNVVASFIKLLSE